MIQRVQSIYLGLAIICIALLFIFPLFSIDILISNEYTGKVDFNATLGANGLMGDEVISKKVPIYFGYLFLLFLLLLALFMFKNRKRQLMICRIAFFFHFIAVVGVYAFYYFGKPTLLKLLAENSLYTEVDFGLMTGFFLILSPLAFIVLAIRGIKKDENLVKSLDRLR